MPKVDIYSDIHADSWYRFYKHSPEFKLVDRVQKTPDANIAIFAGDAGNGYDWFEYVVKMLQDMYEHVVYVEGNHDYYSTGIGEEDRSLRIFEFEGLKFVTATLWTNFWGNHLYHGEIARRCINDFSLIPDFSNGWEGIERCVRSFQRAVEFLYDADSPVCVVTHFAPALQSVHPIYAGNPLNPYFVNDEEQMVRDIAPKLWVHGHTHSQFDYCINNTRVICNPVGYPKENMNSLVIIPRTIEL